MENHYHAERADEACMEYGKRRARESGGWHYAYEQWRAGAAWALRDLSEEIGCSHSRVQLLERANDIASLPAPESRAT